MSPDPESRFAEHRGYRIAYSVSGPESSPAIALQHGWTGSKEDMADYREAFADAGYRCVAIDSLGHGESDKPTDANRYQRAERAGDVVAVLDAEGIDRAHLIGYSMGGWIACCVAEFRPERLLSLIIGGHCPGTGTTEELGLPADGPLFSFEQVLEGYELGLDQSVLPAMRHSFDALEDVATHEQAVADAGVPVLLWKGRGEPVICKKGEAVARRRGWDFFAVDGDHIEAAMNHETSVPRLLEFVGRLKA